jgi:hypothetical protein
MKQHYSLFAFLVIFNFSLIISAPRHDDVVFPEKQDQEQLFPHTNLQPENSAFFEENIIIQNNENTNESFCLIFQKSRAGNKVQNGDELGCILFEGMDDFQTAAKITAHVDGTPGNNKVPGRLEFYTAPAAA